MKNRRCTFHLPCRTSSAWSTRSIRSRSLRQGLGTLDKSDLRRIATPSWLIADTFHLSSNRQPTLCASPEAASDSHQGGRVSDLPSHVADGADRIRKALADWRPESAASFARRALRELPFLRVERKSHEIRAGANTHLSEHLVQVILDGTRADEQLPGDFRVRRTFRDEPRDARFLRC